MIHDVNDSASGVSARWWVVGGGNLVLVLASLGTTVAMVVRPEDFLPPGIAGEEAGRFFGGYVAVRGLALALAVVWALGLRSSVLLGAAVGFSAVIQFADGLIGVYYRNAAQAGIPLVMAILQMASARWLLRRSGTYQS